MARAKKVSIMNKPESSVHSSDLLGVLFKCRCGHVWESAVGGAWLQMPLCPECTHIISSPAVAWMGKWGDSGLHGVIDMLADALVMAVKHIPEGHADRLRISQIATQAQHNLRSRMPNTSVSGTAQEHK